MPEKYFYIMMFIMSRTQYTYYTNLKNVLFILVLDKTNNPTRPPGNILCVCGQGLIHPILNCKAGVPDFSTQHTHGMQFLSISWFQGSMGPLCDDMFPHRCHQAYNTGAGLVLAVQIDRLCFLNWLKSSALHISVYFSMISLSETTGLL